MVKDVGNKSGLASARSPADYFLHPGFFNDPSLLFRARVLIAAQCAEYSLGALD